MASIQEQLGSVASLPQRDKTQAYLDVLERAVVPSKDPSTFTTFVEAATGESVGQVVARQVLAAYVNAVCAVADRELRKQLVELSLERIQPHIATFEEQVCQLRETLADLQEQDYDFSDAAKTLIGIPLESGHRNVSDEYKLSIYVRIVRNFLEEEDAVSAETYFNRASLLMHSTKDLATQVAFKLCQARIADYSRKFADASVKYHEISYVAALDEQERMQCLSAAIVCAVLAPAGPSRSRILSSLFRDERSPETEHFNILSKMFLDQMIRPDEAAGFEKALKTHQMAKLPRSNIVLAEDEETGGSSKAKRGPETVLDRAVMEHNLLAASRIYYNITFKGLGLLLSLTPSAAEAMARDMIQQQRLHGSIDQVEGLIAFDPDVREGDGVVSNVAANADNEIDPPDEAASAPATARWDMQVRQTLQMVESIATRCDALMAGSSMALDINSLPSAAA